MTHTIQKTGRCPTCGAATPNPAAAAAASDPAVAFQADIVRYDLEALAAEAAEDRVYDESAKVRATQEDIRRLLEKRRRTR